MDFRLVLVLGPLAIAASWAVFNIGAAAISQLQRYLGREA